MRDPDLSIYIFSCTVRHLQNKLRIAVSRSLNYISSHYQIESQISSKSRKKGIKDLGFVKGGDPFLLHYSQMVVFVSVQPAV